MRHFIAFQRSDGHCVSWLLSATCFDTAMRTYLQRHVGATIRDQDGTIYVPRSFRSGAEYGHVIECLESELKSNDGTWGQLWEVRELRQAHWDAACAEAFCSSDLEEIELHVQRCRPVFLDDNPGMRARAFVWRLREGALVSFYKRKSPQFKAPIRVIARYLVPSRHDITPDVQRWSGSYDDIANQLDLLYPLEDG